ncbi:MAG: hypothetical protein WCH61_04740 [bacterium]
MTRGKGERFSLEMLVLLATRADLDVVFTAYLRGVPEHLGHLFRRRPGPDRHAGS